MYESTIFFQTKEEINIVSEHFRTFYHMRCHFTKLDVNNYEELTINETLNDVDGCFIVVAMSSVD